MIRLILPVLASLTTLTGSPVATAQTAPKPPAANPPAPKQGPAPTSAAFRVEGFRSAKFGMTQDEVKAAIGKDFTLPTSAITATQNPIDGTSALSVKVTHLDPGPGAAGITYVFGASKKTLIHINVAWASSAAPTVDERKDIITAALRLAVYFKGQAWPANRTITGAALPGNIVLIFEGVDDAGGGVEVSTTGVPVQMADPKAPKLPEPTGPAQLKVAYSANHDHPDLIKIPPGAF